MGHGASDKLYVTVRRFLPSLPSFAADFPLPHLIIVFSAASSSPVNSFDDIQHAEHSGALGQHTAGSVGAQAKKTVLSKLPFDCCALSLKPFDTPVCTIDGTVYDLLAIIPFLREHGTDPMTGKKMSAGDLVRLHFAKNNEGVSPLSPL